MLLATVQADLQRIRVFASGRLTFDESFVVLSFQRVRDLSLSFSLSLTLCLFYTHSLPLSYLWTLNPQPQTERIVLLTTVQADLLAQAEKMWRQHTSQV